MKKFIRSAAILSALAIVLTGCGERDLVTNIYESTVNAPLAQNTSSVTNESADKTNGESIAQSTENSAPASEVSTVGTNSGDSSMPKDIIPEKNYEAFGELADIVEDSRTVEELNAELAEYNAEYPDYAAENAEITDNGEPVTSGLLKNGLIVRFDHGDGYEEFTVVRTPKDAIPDDGYEATKKRWKIVDDSRTIEEFNAEIAEYNLEYPDFAIENAEITDNGEPVISGLLKNGMVGRFDLADGGYEEFAVVRAPKDEIPESNYEAFEERSEIVEDSRTVEELNAEIAEYNLEYPDFAITSVEITDNGEPITSGLLKNGMIVRFNYVGGGYEEFTVRSELWDD